MRKWTRWLIVRTDFRVGSLVSLGIQSRHGESVHINVGLHTLRQCDVRRQCHCEVVSLLTMMIAFITEM